MGILGDGRQLRWHILHDTACLPTGEVTHPRATKLLMRRLLLALGASIALACTSPTLPLPPPAAPSIVTGTEPNTFRLTSENGAQPNALIIVVNRNESLTREERVNGTIADDQGTWEVTVKGAVGDFVDIAQESNSARSASTTVQLR